MSETEDAKHESKSASGTAVAFRDWLAAPRGRVWTLVLLTLVAYFPALGAGFVWDDDLHLLNHIVIRENGLYRVLFTADSFTYWPVTFGSYWIEHQLWGLNPAGYHIDNVLIHAACAILLWRILLRLAIPHPWLIALLFALHPVNVESVAWVTQRKNLCSLFFFLLAWLWFLRFEDGARRRDYWFALGSFVLAMLSKGSAMTLPVVLLLGVWWRKGTLTRGDLARSLPFFLVTLGLGFSEAFFQTRAVAGDAVREDTPLQYILGAGWIAWFYIYKALLPLNLSFVYPRWEVDPSDPLAWLPNLALIALPLWFWLKRRTWGRPFFFATAYFVVTISPAMGFVHFYFLRFSYVADHYQYNSIPAVIALLVWLLGRGVARIREGRPRIFALAGGALVVAYACLSFAQTRIYKDAETLWLDTLKKNPDAWLARHNYGELLFHEKRYDEARAQFDEMIRLEPDEPKGRLNLARLLAETGQYAEAREQLKTVFELLPGHPDGHFEIARTYMMENRFEEALTAYEQAIRSNPEFAGAFAGRGMAERRLGRTADAAASFERAVRFDPDNADAHLGLADLAYDAGRLNEALRGYLRVQEINPRYPGIYNNLGIVCARMGRLDEAVELFENALREDPESDAAKRNLEQARRSKAEKSAQ